MPKWDRLTSTLFKVAVLQDFTGLSILHNIITLCQKDAEVEFRPGLELEKYYYSNLVS